MASSVFLRGSTVSGEEEEGREVEGALWAVKWRLSEWEAQLQRLQPRSLAAKRPRPRGGGGHSGPALRAHRLPLPLRPSSSAQRPQESSWPVARRCPRPPPSRGRPLARLRRGPPFASPFPSHLPPSLLPIPLPHCPLPQFSIPFPPGLGGPRPSPTCFGLQPTRSHRCHFPLMWAPAGCPRQSPSSRFRWAFPSLGVAF